MIGAVKYYWVLVKYAPLMQSDSRKTHYKTTHFWLVICKTNLDSKRDPKNVNALECILTSFMSLNSL